MIPGVRPGLECMASNHDFEGADHGSDVSVIFVDAPPGRGPALHSHPYIETFVIQAGRVRFSVDGRTIDAAAGDVVVAPAGAARGCTPLEPDGARMVTIHSAERFVTTGVETR